jgi:putative oxygen-independent coproporphyrinogen III oxidase
MMIRHLYIHIPFCARICPYCAFYKDLIDRSQMARFCEAILREIEEQHRVMEISNPPRRLVPTTIYFGGGTPTALTISQLEFLLRGIQERVDLSHVREWTMEANPGSISPRKAALLARLGVTRISLGVQSWDHRLLKILGRDHSPRQAAESFRILRKAGFSNINIDLMFALPGQTPDQWRTTLETTIALGPEHISTYCLTYEEDTEFFVRHARGEFRADTDAEARFFELAMSMLDASGYEHYETSNYARQGFASFHNRAYWGGEDYLGIGPSAFSTVGLRRWQNVPNYRQYADRLLRSQSAIASEEDLTMEIKRSEKIALGLRTRNGVPASLLESFARETQEFVRLGLLQRSNGNFVLTRAGKLVADSVAAAFV